MGLYSTYLTTFIIITMRILSRPTIYGFERLLPKYTLPHRRFIPPNNVFEGKLDASYTRMADSIQRRRNGTTVLPRLTLKSSTERQSLKFVSLALLIC